MRRCKEEETITEDPDPGARQHSDDMSVSSDDVDHHQILEDAAFAQYNNYDAAAVTRAVLQATTYREEYFATETLVQQFKKDAAEMDRALRTKLATAMAHEFDLPLERVQEVSNNATVNAFEEILGRRHEKTVADSVINPIYPDTRVLGTRIIDGQTIEDVIVEIPVEDTLQALLSDPVLWADCTRPHPEFTGNITDVRDSYSWRSHPMARLNLAFFFFFYTDEVIAVCVAGPAMPYNAAGRTVLSHRPISWFAQIQFWVLGSTQPQC